MSNYSVKDDAHVTMAITLKHHQLQREQLQTLDITDFIDYMFRFKWKFKSPDNQMSAINDIMHTKCEDIVAFLSRQAIIDSAKHELSDYKDLFEVD